MQERINAYWSGRADEFSQNRLEDLKGPARNIWRDIIRENMPDKTNIRALDVGTGAGFHVFLLADMGVSASGVDYSAAMIEKAKINAKMLGYDDVVFLRMDAQKLSFPDASFDLIISRNVTWTLPDPRQAYSEWCRVLAPGGVMMNFDANYGHAFKLADRDGITDKQRTDWKACNYKVQGRKMIRERNDIAQKLYICDEIRPQWDVAVLLENGISHITIQTDIGRRLYPNQGDNGIKEDSSYHAPLFMVTGMKHTFR